MLVCLFLCANQIFSSPILGEVPEWRECERKRVYQRVEAYYEGGSTFWLERFLSDGASECHYLFWQYEHFVDRRSWELLIEFHFHVSQNQLLTY